VVMLQLRDRPARFAPAYLSIDPKASLGLRAARYHFSTNPIPPRITVWIPFSQIDPVSTTLVATHLLIAADLPKPTSFAVAGCGIRINRADLARMDGSRKS